MTKRDTKLDIIRILACFMVVLMHSPVPSENADGIFLNIMGYFTAPCIGLFFMVSGALLLPIKTDYVAFIRKRFSKIAIPTIIWSLVYILFKLYDSDSEIDIFQSIVSIPFSPQGNGVLWFMYTLAGLYLLAPILSAWLERATQREMLIVLMLWCITLCYPLFDFYVSINTSTTGALYYFTGYAGYFMLGYYMKKYPDSISIIGVWSLALLGILLLLTLKYFAIKFDFFTLFWYESIFIAALAIAIWRLVNPKAILLNNRYLGGGYNPWTFKPYVRNIPRTYNNNATFALVSRLDYQHLKLHDTKSCNCFSYVYIVGIVLLDAFIYSIFSMVYRISPQNFSN